MFTKGLRQYFWPLPILAILVCLAVTAAAANPLGQDGPESPGVDEVTPIAVESVEAAPAGPDLAEDINFMAAPGTNMNYQGYLTDAGGAPLTGTHDMIFSLYNTETAGTKYWGDETHAGVVVSRGLFQVTLGETIPILPTTFTQQLYLQVTVDGTALPRQALNTVPYAMAMPAGAQVRGSTTTATGYGLMVVNSAGRGIYADSVGNGTYSLFSADVTYSDEGYSGPDTSVFIPSMNAAVKYADIGKASVRLQTYGEVQIDATVAGTADVELPIQMEIPFGRSYQLKSYTVYYKTNNAANFITNSWLLGRNISTGATVNLGSDTADHKSTTYGSFTVTLTTPVTIDVAHVLTNMQLRITQADAASIITIYGVRLVLDSSY